MPEFLLEVGCEELPASFVEKAYTDLAGALAKELESLGLKNSEPVCMGTPRRLIVSFPDLKSRQDDSTKEQRGPSLAAAYGPDGKPTGALLGFCKSQGVSPDDLRKDEQYVWVTKHIPGRDTSEVLAEILPGIILGLSFEKSMRWGSSHRFARPIRWVVAAFDGRRVPFDIVGIPSTLLSTGHRFYSPHDFEAKTLEELVSKLRTSFVEPDPARRRQLILDQAHAVAEGTPEITEELLDENTFLCEWPTAIRGTFPGSYLELPEPVLVTAMAKHERMFPIRDASGKLTNSFVFIRNSGEDETVRRGCEWVLGARFNDARFFYEQDQKHNLDYFLEKTSEILFQAQLGTVRQRADRLANLAGAVGHFLGVSPEDIKFAMDAGLYSKADLASGLVSELSSLQGVIGSEYARKEGFSAPVIEALRLQYCSSFDANGNSLSDVAVCLVIADNLDKLAGYLGLGLEPTGSSDPYALRKAVSTLITIGRNWKRRSIGYAELLDVAFEIYSQNGATLDSVRGKASCAAIFKSRYESIYDNYRHDVVKAAVPESDDKAMNPGEVEFRLKIVDELRQDTKFVQAASRPINIVAAALKKREQFLGDGKIYEVKFDEKGDDSPEAAALANAIDLTKTGKSIKEFLLDLIDPINNFFDNNLIMAEDPTVRFQRLSLANRVASTILEFGDFTKLEG